MIDFANNSEYRLFLLKITQKNKLEYKTINLQKDINKVTKIIMK